MIGISVHKDLGARRVSKIRYSPCIRIIIPYITPYYDIGYLTYDISTYLDISYFTSPCLASIVDLHMHVRVRLCECQCAIACMRVCVCVCMCVRVHRNSYLINISVLESNTH